jgi:hypothetical protein
MFRRGWSERSLGKIAGGNFRRVFREVERAAEKAKTTVPKRAFPRPRRRVNVRP